MKTIDGFCIKELRLRNYSEIWGKVSGCKRVNIPMDDELFQKVFKISKITGIRATELLRGIIDSFTSQISIQEVKYEKYKKS